MPRLDISWCMVYDVLVMAKSFKIVFYSLGFILKWTKIVTTDLSHVGKDVNFCPVIKKLTEPFGMACRLLKKKWVRADDGWVGMVVTKSSMTINKFRPPHFFIYAMCSWIQLTSIVVRVLKESCKTPSISLVVRYMILHAFFARNYSLVRKFDNNVDFPDPGDPSRSITKCLLNTSFVVGWRLIRLSSFVTGSILIAVDSYLSLMTLNLYIKSYPGTK